VSGKKSAEPLRIRGLMLDPARLTERHEFYFDVLERMAAWGFNTLWWHFVDDEGFVLKLDGHPELASPYAFSKAETRRLVRRAGQLGIDVVPEVECLGHARYITRLPRYAHLADGDPHHFNAVCPSHPDTIKLLGEIVEEVAGLFPSEFFHAGLDEVDLSGCARCRRRIARRGHWRLFADHVRALHDILASRGKRMVMWADHLEREPRMLGAIPKDIVLAHWHYGSVNASGQFERSLDAGFEIVGASAMLRHGNVVTPAAAQMSNTEAMVAEGRRLAGKGMLGAVNTWWTPRRIVRDAALPMAAYTGHLLAGGQADRAAFLASYVRETFGLRSKAVADAINTLHDEAITLPVFTAFAFDSPADVVEAAALSRMERARRQVEGLAEAADVLKAARAKVAKARAEYDAILLAARVARDLARNAADLLQAAGQFRQAEALRDRGYERAKVAGALDEAAATVAGVAGRLDEMLAALSSDWDRTRHRADAKKAVRPLDAPCPRDSLVGRVARSRAYAAALHRSLARAVVAYRRGGVLPGGPSAG
jgi:hypothetical protein